MPDQDEPQNDQDDQQLDNPEQVEESQAEEQTEGAEQQTQEEPKQSEEATLTGYDTLPQAQQQELKDLSDEDLNAIVAQLKPGDDGTVDLKDVVRVLHNRNQATSQQTARQEAVNVFNELRQEERQWEEAFKDYSDLRTDNDLRDTVQALRDQAMLRGGYLTPKQAADKLFKKVSAAKAEGARQSQESVRVQQAAHLETSEVQADNTNDSQKEQWARVDKPGLEGSQARAEILKSWIEKGDIRTSA